MQILNPLLPVLTFPIPINMQGWKDLTKGIYTDMLRDTPTRIQISESKTYNTQRTIGNWVSAHWGENIPTMQCTGNIIALPGQETLSMLSLFILRMLYRLDKNNIRNLGMGSKIARMINGGTIFGATAINDILNSEFANFNINAGIQSAMAGYSLTAYLKRLADIDATGLSPTYIMYDNKIYQGYFTNFSYTRDIKNVRKIQYQFSLNIEWDSSDGLIDWFKNSSNLNTIIQGIEVA